VTQDSDHTQDDIALAGEYALHLLDAESRVAFEIRLADDVALQGLLREWDESFLPWSDDIDAITPRPQVKLAIDARLFGPKKPRFSLRSAFGLRVALVGFAAVATLVIIVGPSVWNVPNGPQYIAEIAGADRSLVVTASFDLSSAELSITRIAGAAVPGRVLELWLIAEGAAAPVSLGVMPDITPATLSVRKELRSLMIGGTLAISDEPLGGSLTGAPTGAVLAAGKITLS
jgi:anti-sigma-K factor RskA